MLPTLREDVRSFPPSPKKLPVSVIPAREFRERVERRLDALALEAMEHAAPSDPLMDFLHAQLPVAAPPGALLRDPEVPSPRFLRDAPVFLHPLRFGRLRLFLSRFVGRTAWKGWAR